MKQTIIISVVSAAIVTLCGLGLFSLTLKPAVKSFGDSAIPNASNNVVNGSVVVSATTSTLVLRSRGNRNYAAIVNNSANVVWISLGSAAVANQGIMLNANGDSYEINTLNLYTGPVYAIASSSTSTVSTIDEY